MRAGIKPAPTILLVLTVLLCSTAHSAPPPAQEYGQLWPAFRPSTEERRIAEQVRALTAKQPLALDPALSRAAREYGAHAAMAEAEGKQLGGETLSEDLWRSGRADVEVLPLVIRGGRGQERTQIVEQFVGGSILGRGYSHLGVGLHGEVATLLFTRRTVKLRRIARSLPADRPVELAFGMAPRHHAPWVLMTTPAGKVRRTPMRPGDRDGDVVGLLSPVDGPGEYKIEILARGPSGPVVGALFPLYFGKPAPALPRLQLLPVTAPPTPREAVQRAGAVLDEARQRRGLPELGREPALARMAELRARELAASADLIHASPEGEQLLQRLTREGLPVGRAAENLAVGPSPEAAARACLSSPSHLANLIDERPTHAGLAVMPSSSAGGTRQFTLVQIFAELLPEAAGHKLAEELVQRINQKRMAAGLGPLARNEDLDAVTLDHCRAMIHEDHFGDELPNGRSLVRQVGQRTTVRRVAADLFVAPRIDRALDSDKLLDPKHQLVGLAVVQASSPRYGANLLWMVIVYGQD